MTSNKEKPTPEAKALSVYLMALKSPSNDYKEKSKRINKQYNRVLSGEISREEYLEEVQSMLDSLGGYSEVVRKTVQHYLNTTGEWKLEGDDKYCTDAQKVVDEIMKLKKK